MFSVPSGFSARPDQSSIQTVLALGTSSHPDGGSSAAAPPMDMEDGPLVESGLPGCPFRFTPYSGQPFADGNPAFGLQLHHPRFLEFVGAPRSARLLYRSPTFWVDQLGKEQVMAQSSYTVAVCHVVEPHVIRDDGLGHRTDGVSSR